ncbi:SusD/RagB family nutrient-binding outer membrane lipoprotein [Chitinophaga japonensis]|uniref:SusD-like starch-binding protein associating with outer membrane n=1 Tax=Chitinophaga japonensis TaxID=104662 RepID=A0A562TF07_CHIJA|nr:SusD/RagB family nutrient-binding outer membrane lipoprotein [Chitinophaga japonensis]TWI92121.1 SusD-like starch-binding protein associating with outer membrane [Chitinophaga japonensis]
MLKSFHKLICVAVTGLLALSACDKGFEEMNVNPDASPAVEPEYMFSKALLDGVSGGYGTTITTWYSTSMVCAGGAIQHYATYKDVPGLGDKYYWQQGTYPYAFFENTYPGAVNEIATVINALQEEPATNVNKLSIARIWRVYIMHRITDLFGDVPYTDAVNGYTDNNFTPAYDQQSAIYADMLRELEEAAAAFSEGQPTFGAGDFIYNGDVARWKKFAYSLMLRLGMRLSKVDAAQAQTWVQKAIAGGVIMEDADRAYMKYADGPQTYNQNPASYDMLANNFAVANGDGNTEGGKYAKTFIDYLKNNNDPRLGVISVVWVSGKADTSAALQKGMPNGLLGKPADFVTYSEPNPNTVLLKSAPYIVMSAGEVNLLLAEAAIRGWYAGDAATAYQDGISASMRNWSLFGSGGVISSERISAYLAAHAFNSAGTFEQQMEQIHTQLWVTLLLDEQEAWSDWRRSGYPVLTPVNVPGNITNGVIPRRLIYPPSEESVNSANLQAALQRQGPNDFTTRVWWDK